MAAHPSPRLRFGVFEVDLQSGELRKQGFKIKLQEQPFQVLAALLKRPGEVVTRDALREHLGASSAFVDFDHSLNKAINKIREALADSAESPRFVETLARRGYRWIAPVEYDCEAAPAERSFIAASRRYRQWAILMFSAMVVALAWSGSRLYTGLVANKFSVPFQKTNISRITSTGATTNAAISPDGKYVAFVMSENGKASLWVRQIGTSSNVQISPPTAAGFEGLTFSRDGNFLYYIKNDGKGLATLYELPVLGGAARKLIADVPRQITVSPDGKRLAFTRFFPGKESAVIVANADGTGQRKLITRRGNEYFSGAVAWSPDGKSIVCASGIVTSEPSETLLAISVESGLAKPMTTATWFHVGSIAWIPNGRALIVNAADEISEVERIWHLSYPGGKARRIANDPNDYTGMSLTADAQSLVAVQRDQAYSIWIAPKGETSARQITSNASRYDGANGIAWTADNRIVYGSRSSSNFEIWIMKPDGSDRHQLADDGRFPRVTSDGRHVVFTSDRAGIPHIWRVDIDGTNHEQLTNGQGEVGADCSPDGKWLVYTAAQEGWTLWKAPTPEGPSGIRPVQLTQTLGADPSISPDGKMIAFNYRDEHASPTEGTAVIPFEGGPPIKFIDFEMPVRWTSDGRAVLHVRVPVGVANIWSQPIAGGRPKQLTDFRAEEISSFDWSRDGKRLAFVRPAQTSDAVLIRNLE
jgi:Tol biopolymer transport system component/DNA-binding winged helix-turn-helix (wHTH) protein